MKIEFIIIGDEILQGKIQEGILKPLASTLLDWGHVIDHVTICPDDIHEIKRLVLQAKERSNLILISGGLGPTPDDLTRQALSETFKRPLVFSLEAKNLTLKHYQRIQKRPQSDHPYFTLPEDFKTLENFAGLAPGLFYQSESTGLFALPGVPREFFNMLQVHVKKFIEEKNTDKQKKQYFVCRTHSVPEEQIFNHVDPTLWAKLGEIGHVASLPQVAGVDIHLNCTASSDSEMKDKNKQFLDIIKNSPIAQYTWSLDKTTSYEKIVQFLKTKNWTLSTAESCTGGRLASALTEVPGVSAHFAGSIVSYQEHIKENFLHVKKDTIVQYGLVSEEVALEMAKGISQQFQTDIVLSCTGNAGPDPQGVPTGKVCIGIGIQGDFSTLTYYSKGDRQKNLGNFTQKIFITLIQLLIQKNLIKLF